MNTPIVLPDTIETLAGQLLVATPQLSGSVFDRSVIYMCGHNRDGAMGIMINKPLESDKRAEVLSQLSMAHRIGDRTLPVLFGGPVDPHRGFIVHDGAYAQETAISTNGGVTVTANNVVLTGWLDGAFTARAMLALGYAGWSKGQLEREIEQGSWMTAPATQQILFATAPEARWDLAVASMGFDLSKYSGVVGHA